MHYTLRIRVLCSEKELILSGLGVRTGRAYCSIRYHNDLEVDAKAELLTVTIND